MEIDMGWWKVTDIESGGISCERPSGAPPDGLLNAVPGRDKPYDTYGGDGPADAMDKTIDDIDAQFLAAWNRHASPNEMRACFNFCLGGFIRHVHTLQVPGIDIGQVANS
jgi:hypothetical protein